MWRLWIATGAVLWALAMAQAQFASFPPGTFNNKAARDPAPGGGGSVTVDVNEDVYCVSIGGTSSPFCNGYALNSNSFYNTSNGAAGGTNWMNVSAGNALVCAVVRQHASNNVTAGLQPTWDSSGGSPQNMAQIVHVSSGTTLDVSLWGLLSPHPGALQLHVTATNVATDNFVSCISFSGANSAFGTAFANTNTGSSVSSVSCTSGSGHQVVGVNTSTVVTGLLGTVIFNDNGRGANINGAAAYVPGTSPTVGYTLATATLIACTDVSP